MADLSEASAAFSVSPSTLTYTAMVGGANQVRSVTVTNKGTSTLTVTWADSINWLGGTSGNTVTMPPGGSATITHTASPAGLGAGTYSGTATISGGGIIKQVVPVTLTVTQSTPTSGFSVSPSTLAYTGTVGGANQARGVTVTNKGTSTLTVTWADSINWLGGTSGNTVTMPPGGSATITHTASPAGLGAGTYSGTATIAVGGITKQVVPVTLTVTSGGSTTPAVGLAPTNLAFTGSVGGANPAVQTISIANTGGGALTWSASDNASWLTVSPASGSGNGTVTATVNTAGLVAGTLNATITVVATGATTKSVPVTLTVTALSTGAATLSWDASRSSDVVGYKVYKATGSGVYGAPIAILKGSVLSYQGIGLNANTTYFFVVTAYDAAGNESLHSNEVSKSIY